MTPQYILVIAVYVDDFLLFSTDVTLIQNVKMQLMTIFHMKDLGEAKQVLGMRITRSDDAVMLDQERYVDELLIQDDHSVDTGGSTSAINKNWINNGGAEAAHGKDAVPAAGRRIAVSGALHTAGHSIRCECGE
ncbi:hypothetical protein RP20_CCG008337 [Aedes albopictus]|nr:hypothetical protein RP20_CCG008337 [Aedes albopictus]